MRSWGLQKILKESWVGVEGRGDKEGGEEEEEEDLNVDRFNASTDFRFRRF